MRKFYRTLITLEVLSEYEPVPEDFTLEHITYEIQEGAWSGMRTEYSYQELTPKQMVECTIGQGSDPDFFGLDKNGNDVLEHEMEMGLNLTVDHGHVYTDGDAKDGE